MNIWKGIIIFFVGQENERIKSVVFISLFLPLKKEEL